jgi:Flp pilus assembly protein TadG
MNARPVQASAFVRRPGDQGSLSIFAVIITLVVVTFFGAAVDFSVKLQARHDASIAAEEAARAGATQVDRDRAYAHGGQFVIDQAAAIHAAEQYLRSGGYEGSVSAAGTTAIRVRVTLSKPTIFLAAIGIRHLNVEASAIADLTSGVEGENR